MAEAPRIRQSRWYPAHTLIVKGFVAAVILAVVIAVLFPVYATGGREVAANDLSSMKQVNLGLIMYSGDSDNRYPISAKWMDAIQPYVENEAILHSLALLPSDQTSGPINSDPYGIAFRKNLACKNVQAIAEPEQIAAVFDAANLSRNAAGDLDLLPDPPRHKNDTGTYNLVGFVDGHVKQVPKPVVVVR